MKEAVFLSASVPDPNRAPEYARSADSVAISAAVTALAYTTLGRRPLVWGGHPAITPMVWVVAESIGVNYGEWVTLYQSKFFKDQFPEDNSKFQNVIYTDAVIGDQDASLRELRKRMFKENTFDTGVFIGGMEGVLQEYKLFRDYQPNAALVPVISTGGAVLELAKSFPERDLVDDFDYVALFHRRLGIDSRERRYRSPKEQPPNIPDRLVRTPQ
jgi:hypothetical protein